MTSLPALGSDEFRLLKMTGVDSIIKCDVEVHKLGRAEQDSESGVKYYALSYAWGDGSQKCAISINGLPFNVTQNLHSALCALYHREEIRHEWHWIDQICINQTDDEEKSIQVGAMHRIYTFAKRTLIWLGPGTDETNIAMDNLRKLTDEMGSPPFPDDLQGKEAIQRRLAPRNHLVWRAIVKLYGLPWFRRVWILQEVVLSKGAYVLCGERTLTWSTLVEFADAIVAIWPAVLMNAGEDPAQKTVSGFVSCSQINRFQTDATARRLFPLLTTTRDRETSNPVDHIYGIAAMLPTEQRAVINIDYRLNYVDAVLTFCRGFIENDPLLYVLGMAPSIDRNPGLPSWCPDFGFTSSESSQFSTYMGFRAGFTQWNQRKSQIRVLNDPMYAISVPGFRVDVVKAIVESQSRMELDMRAKGAAVLAWESRCEQLLERNQPDQAEQVSSQEAYARALIAGHWHPTHPVPPEYHLHKVLIATRRYWKEVATTTTTDFRTYPVSKDEILRFDVAVNMQEKRRFFSTENGRIGLGPSRVQPGDVVCVFDSGACLWTLRYSKDSKEGAFELIGDVYIQEFMDLKVTLKDNATETGRPEEFVIV